MTKKSAFLCAVFAIIIMLVCTFIAVGSSKPLKMQLKPIDIDAEYVTKEAADKVVSEVFSQR